MKRPLLAFIAMCIPTIAFGQQPGTSAVDEGVVVPSRVAASAATSAVQTGSTSPGPRRRPSMVGYIENASIGNKLRVRFDAGNGVQSADRAEFFYAKCGCYRFLPASDPKFDPDAAGPGPGVLTSADYTQFNVYGEYAFSGRVSVVGELPVRWLKPQSFVAGTGSFGDTSGVSDIRGGVKLSLVTDANSQLTFQGMITGPTGDSREGLGTDHWSVEPALLYETQIADRVGVEAQFGTVFPIDGSEGVPTSSPDKFAGKVIYYGVGPSVDIYSSGSTRLSPVVELVGWHVVDGYSTADGAPANGTNIVNLKLGGRLAFGASSVYVGWGKALTDAAWYDHLVRVEYRYGF